MICTIRTEADAENIWGGLDSVIRSAASKLLARFITIELAVAHVKQCLANGQGIKVEFDFDEYGDGGSMEVLGLDG